MEEEDQAVFSEVKIEMDVAEPAYWTTQHGTQEQGQGKSVALSAGFVLITFSVSKQQKNPHKLCKTHAQNKTCGRKLPAISLAKFMSKEISKAVSNSENDSIH
jgi:hypothetical protein